MKLQIPVIHLEVAPRLVETESELRRLRYVNAITYEQRQFYLDSSGQWYEGKLRSWSNGSNLLERYILDRDFIDAEIEFEQLEECPFTKVAWFRYLSSGLWMEKSKAKAQRRLLRQIETVPNLIDWLRRNKRLMKPFK